MEWDQQKILFFIEQFRRKPILWDPLDPHYYNKFKKHDAWQELAAEMEGTEEECKRKISSLLASLRREKAKVTKSKGTGKGTEEVYSSNWFAFKALAFLMDRNKPRPTAETLETTAVTREDAEESIVTDEATNETTQNETVSVEDELRPARPKKMKKNHLNADEMMASAFTILKDATKKNEITARPMDECESFGLFVTNKLKNYSNWTRSTVQHYISNILFDADRGRYDIYPINDPNNRYGYGGQSEQYTVQTTPLPTPSPQSSLGSERSYGYSPHHEHSLEHQLVSVARSASAPPQPDRQVISPAQSHRPRSATVPHPEPSQLTDQESQGLLDEYGDLINL